MPPYAGQPPQHIPAPPYAAPPTYTQTSSATPRPRRSLWIVLSVAVVVIVAAGAGVVLGRGTGGQTPAPTAPSAAAPVAASTATADRAVCIDLDARGGALYNVFVVPMMAGPRGQTSVDVDVAQFARAVTTVGQIGSGQLADASPAVRDEGQRLVAAR